MPDRKNGEGKELLTVSQFAKLVNAKRSQLLYYDKNGYFVPAARTEAGRQATNRRYSLDQVFSFRMLGFMQQLGCSLEEASRYLASDWTGRADLLTEQETRLSQEMRRLQAMRESIALLLALGRLIADTGPDRPALSTLNEPYYGIYHEINPPCLRSTEEFAQRYIRHYESVKNEPDLLPAPVILIYSVNVTKDGRFPVTGMLSLFRRGMGRERSNYVLPAGRYLLLALHGPIGSLAWALMGNRNYLWAHALKRCSPIMACNMGVMQARQEAQYAECVFFPVCDGATPIGEKPALPGID